MNYKNCTRISKNFILLSVFFIILNCEKSDPNLSYLVKDAIHQTIGLEKISHLEFILNRDTVYIYPCSFTGDTSIYNEKLSTLLPNHIDRWVIKSINSNEIRNWTIDDRFEYLTLYLERDNNTFTLNFIKETKFNIQDDNIMIDRPRLTLSYIHKDGVWILKKINPWWG